MTTAQPSRKRERLDLRATPAQAAVIREAARDTERTVTDFVMQAAVEEAQRIIADRSHFLLNDAEWQRFNEILERPATVKPKLSALLQSEEVNVA